MPRWLVVGAGSFGTAICHVLADRPVDVTLAARTSEQAATLRADGANERYFPGIAFAPGLAITSVDEALAEHWDAIAVAVPASAFADMLHRVVGCADTYLSLGKGLDPSGRTLGQVAADHLDPARYVVLSGPNIAREMMHGLPTAAVAAGIDADVVRDVQRIVGGIGFRVYAADDVVGVELAGATKNVVAIAAGVLHGAGLGDNAVAAMMTRGLGEMARLGLARGAQLQTYLGLAGVGDLMVTCRSPHSRNHRAGRLFAAGADAAAIRAEIGQAVEGMRTAPIVRELAREAGLELSICEAVAQVVEGETPLPEVLRQMMLREPGREFGRHDEFVLG